MHDIDDELEEEKRCNKNEIPCKTNKDESLLNIFKSEDDGKVSMNP